MADLNQSEGLEEVVQDQPAPQPSAEETPDEVAEPQEEGDITEEEALANSKNPERTREYIERLKRERDEAIAKSTPQPDYGTSIFDQFRPQEPAVQPQQVAQFSHLNQHQVADIAQNFVEADGTIDINRLNQALTQANEAAKRAEAQAREAQERLARFEENQQAKEAHEAVPEIDPLNKEKFDPELFELVRDRMLRNMYEGRRQSLKEAALDIKRKFRPAVDEKVIEEKAVKTYKQSQVKKVQQGPIEQGRPTPEKIQEADIEDLRRRSRQGDSDAINERLNAYFSGK